MPDSKLGPHIIQGSLRWLSLPSSITFYPVAQCLRVSHPSMWWLSVVAQCHAACWPVSINMNTANIAAFITCCSYLWVSDWNVGMRLFRSFFSVFGSEVVDNRFRIGRWKISSQSLDGQKLETSQWIMPKVTPKVETLPLLKKSSRFLDAFQLENPSQRMQNLQGRHSKPILSNVWLPKTNRANMSPIFDGTKALFISWKIKKKIVWPDIWCCIRHLGCWQNTPKLITSLDQNI